MDSNQINIIAIGGSSGSIPVIMQIVNALPENYPVPIVIIVHRPRNVSSDLAHVISAAHKIREPEDKEPVREGQVYLAPQNYHLLIEDDGTFSMDYSELVNYSRPAIDVTFMSIATVYEKAAMAILLSGANKDGAEGIHAVISKGGRGIVQDPATCQYPLMPEEALKKNNNAVVLDVAAIINTLLDLNSQ